MEETIYFLLEIFYKNRKTRRFNMEIKMPCFSVCQVKDFRKTIMHNMIDIIAARISETACV